MKLHSPLPHKKTRIEIIPLIDIMFFLLACFMLVSLNMIQLHGLNVNLPIASSTSSTPDDTKKPVTITVDKLGTLLVDKDTIPREALPAKLEQLKKDKGDELRIYIAGDKEASHGDVVSILDQVRNAGISKVAIQIKAGSPGSTSTSHIPAATASSPGSAGTSAPAPASSTSAPAPASATVPAADSTPAAPSAPASASAPISAPAPTPAAAAPASVPSPAPAPAPAAPSVPSPAPSSSP